MNTYYKFYPNVFVAKCEEPHEKGEIIQVTTRYGKENDCIVFNLVGKKDGFFYYSIVRADGYNLQEMAKAKAERYAKWASIADAKSEAQFNKSHSITEMIPMGQPILVGHHSEARHRRDIERSWSALGKGVELMEKSEAHESKAEYWAKMANKIDLSMPESLEYYQYLLEAAKEKHEGLKNGTIERGHSFSLTYAKKEVNEIEKKIKIAKLLWD